VRTLGELLTRVSLLVLTFAVSGSSAVASQEESLLVKPLHLTEEAPPLRSVRVLSVGFGEERGRTR